MFTFQSANILASQVPRISYNTVSDNLGKPRRIQITAENMLAQRKIDLSPLLLLIFSQDLSCHCHLPSSRELSARANLLAKEKIPKKYKETPSKYISFKRINNIKINIYRMDYLVVDSLSKIYSLREQTQKIRMN